MTSDPARARLPTDAAARAAMVAHVALFDLVAPVAGQRVLVHDAAGAVGFSAVQLAKAAGALTVFATVTGKVEAELARAAGADLVIDAGEDRVARVRQHAGAERPVHRIVHARLGTEPGFDLALLAPGGVIAAHATSEQPAALRWPWWWKELLAVSVTLRLVELASTPPAALERAATDIAGLRAAGAWLEWAQPSP